MRNINYFDKELSVEEYVKKEVCKNAGTQSVAFKEQLISLCSSAGIECNEKMKKESCLIFFATTALNISSLLIYLE